MLTRQKENHQPGEGMVAKKIDQKTERDFNPTAMLIARLKQRGYSVTRTLVGGFNVSRWGMLRHCSDYETLYEFSRKVGAKL